MRLVISLIFFSFSLSAQLKLVDSVRFDYSSFELDRLGNFYAVNSDSVVSLDTAFNQVFTYDHSSLGSIKSYSASVSLKSLLFDENNQAIIFLDNSLSLQNQLYIPTDFGWVEEVFWLDNGNFLIKTQDNHIKVCDQGFKVLFDSGNLEFQYGLSPNSFKLYSDSEFIFLCSKDLQIQLDINGAFMSQYRLSNVDIVSYHNENFFIQDSTGIRVYNLKSLESINLEIHKKVEDMAVFDDKIYQLSENMLYIYTIQ